ncbi:MAG: hypothetical protein F4210_00455 [Holophagales bacterium]|nr:hypothetical protein [Holophagales bacterium]MYF93989.1 hypothetical protein [Holophagales bacterium]
MSRIHFIVPETDKIRYLGQARREGRSLGAWMREAAEEKLAAARPARRFSAADLRAFYRKCDAAEAGRKEPDWPEQKRLIAESKVRGLEIT